MANGYCYMHGGKSNSNKGEHLITYGWTSRRLTEEEMAKWHDINIDSVDDEIRLVKTRILRVQRALIDMDAIEEDRLEDVSQMAKEQVTTVAEFDHNNEPIPVQETTVLKRLDYEKRLKTLISSLESLYRIKQLIEGDGVKSPETIAREISQFMLQSENPFTEEASDDIDIEMDAP